MSGQLRGGNRVFTRSYGKSGEASVPWDANEHNVVR
jgi:hypothetical protein